MSMSSALPSRSNEPARELMVVDAQPALDYTTEQLDIIRQTVAAGTSDLEFRLFIEVAKRRRLDALTRQIYAVMRYDAEAGRKRMVIQTGIDGYLAIAQRSGDYAGLEDITFDVEEAEHPNRATATVYRWSHGQRVPFTYTARWQEYCQVGRDGQPTNMWRRMPYTMLGKCALARALRQGFPEELSGIYTADEMMQADNPLPTPIAPVARITEESQPQPQAPTSTAARRSNPAPATTIAANNAVWNGLADAKFRQAIKQFGYVTVEQTERFLANAKRFVPNLPDGSPEQAKAYLKMVKADAERAAQADAGKMTEQGYEPPTDDATPDEPESDEEIAYDLQHNPPAALRGAIVP